MDDIDYDKIKADAILAAEQVYATADVDPIQKAMEAAVEYTFLAMSDHVVEENLKGVKAHLEERPEEDDAFLYVESWPAYRAICRRPKLISNEEWRPTAEHIIKALAAYEVPRDPYQNGRTEKTQLGTLKRIDRYQEMLDKAGVKPERGEGDATLGLPHIYWMLMELRDRIEAHDPVYDDGKISRWLGFCDYGIIAHGLTTTEQERDASRPLFRK